MGRLLSFVTITLFPGSLTRTERISLSCASVICIDCKATNQGLAFVIRNGEGAYIVMDPEVKSRVDRIWSQLGLE